MTGWMGIKGAIFVRKMGGIGGREPTRDEMLGNGDVIEHVPYRNAVAYRYRTVLAYSS
jgi:hypothetical protein